ncbi:MAG: FkbM family methyltransferase [Ruminococcus sp.]|nr:FkbM family methyltransferase [Ruminococcus sp.]
MSIESDKLIKEVILEKLSGSGEEAHIDTSGINTVMLDSLDKMNKTSVNRSYRAIPAAGFKGKISRLVKRLMRRLTFWYVEPCMMQQTEYNCANNIFSAQVNSEINTLRCGMKNMEGHSAAIGSLSGNVARNAEALGETNRRLDACENSGAELSAAVDELRRRLDNVEKMNYLFNGGNGMLSFADAGKGALSFSQSGEDSVVRYIFNTSGIDPAGIRYLDLGANHAVELSNTFSFYLSGASGVLLDANPVLTQELSEKRPRDIVINRCISDKPGTKLDFYIMSGDGLSTMDYEAAQGFIRENPALSIEKTVSVDSITIDEIIREHFSEKAPELMNIDVEGMELTILRMIDFAKFRPMIIICEMIEYSSTLTVGAKNQEILSFMRSKGYEEFAFTGINSIFIDNQRKEVRA